VFRLARKALLPLSLLICMAAPVLWVRSYWRSDRIEFAVAHHLMQLEAGTGYAGFTFYNFWCGDRLRWPEYTSHKIMPDDDPLYLPVIYFYRQSYGHDFHVYLPYWLVLMISLAVFTACMVLRNKRLALAHRGLCTVCGYDLRASPDRCPECGTMTPRLT
jgi:hypothetical protein